MKTAKITDLFKVQKVSNSEKKLVNDERNKNKKTTPTTDFVEDVKCDDKDFVQLRMFDLDSKFGPCSGLSRMERWNRAEKYGFNPPMEIRDLILEHSDDTKYTEKYEPMEDKGLFFVLIDFAQEASAL